MNMVQFVTVAAQPADHVAGAQSEPFVEAEALPAGVKHAAEGPVAATRQNKPELGSGRVAKAELLRRTTGELSCGDSYRPAARYALTHLSRHRKSEKNQRNR